MKRCSIGWFLLFTLASTSYGQLMPAAKAQKLRKHFPQVDDPQLQEVLKDPQLILYTDAEMPAAYQIWDGEFQGVHSPSYNISAGSSEQAKGNGNGGNGNIEFPWQGPGGAHRCNNLFVVRFLKLPVENGRRLPVVWHRQHLRGDASSGYAWTYPNGTLFAEVLTMRGPSGLYYTFELRTRTKSGSEWIPNVHRPFPTAESLARRIKELRPAWSTQPQLAKVVEHLERPESPLRLARLTDTTHARREFDQTVGIDDLPAIGDDKLVAELLQTTPFRSAQGELWRVGKGRLATYAPSTQAAWHVVPRNYDAAFISVDQKSCARCHASVNRHVDDFDSGRDWYGRVRGSDRIFSFHPFDPSCISGNGYPSGVRMRTELISAGVLESFNAQKHTAAVYQRCRSE